MIQFYCVFVTVYSAGGTEVRSYELTGFGDEWKAKEAAKALEQSARGIIRYITTVYRK